MINIQKTRVILYDGDRRSVTVYNDFDDPKKWYIVPEPRFAVLDVKGVKVPACALTEYKTNKGTRGTCSFTVELGVSPEALDAVRRALGNDIILAQFDWVSAQAFFVYQTGGKQQQLNTTASSYATQQAAFVIDLPNTDAVNTFKSAFGPGPGSASPFRIDYQLMALSKLPAVVATVTYSASTAVEYQRTVQVDRNVWGHETGRRAEIREQLKKSDAGDVNLDWGVTQPSEELRQRVENWAWTTLEGLVSNAMDEAVRRLGEQNADQFSLTSVSNFTRTYSENQVIEWAITPSAPLPRFSAEEWAMVYRQVDNRNLAVAFTIIAGDLETAKITSVELTVTYPTKKTGNTFTFLPNGASTFTFLADGDMSGGDFNPNYSYQYTVTYAEPGKRYVSPEIPSDATQVRLPVAELGVQTARFIGSNLDFKTDVDFVLIDFFFHTPGNLPNTVEQRKMIDNATEIAIPSRTYLPSANEFSYQLTYVMKDKNQFAVAPQLVFAPQNRELNVVTSPFVSRNVEIVVQNFEEETPVPPVITGIKAVANFRDPLNPVGTLQNGWDFKIPAEEKEYFEGGDWTFDAVNNPAGSFIEYNGTIIYKGKPARRFEKIAVSGEGSLFIDNTSVPFSVEVNPINIKWDESPQLDSVQVDMFLSASQMLLGEKRALFRIGDTGQDFAETTGDETNRVSLIFLPGAEIGGGQRRPTASQYYTFQRLLSRPVQYYYVVAYRYHDGTTKWTKQTASDNRVLVLEPRGESLTRHILSQFVLPE